MYEHLRYIKNNLDEPTGLHFNLAGHNIAHASFEIIDVLTSDPDDPNTSAQRNKREHYWIMQLRTIKPHGINVLLAQWSPIPYSQSSSVNHGANSEVKRSYDKSPTVLLIYSKYASIKINITQKSD